MESQEFHEIDPEVFKALQSIIELDPSHNSQDFNQDIEILTSDTNPGKKRKQEHEVIDMINLDENPLSKEPPKKKKPRKYKNYFDQKSNQSKL